MNALLAALISLTYYLAYLAGQPTIIPVAVTEAGKNMGPETEAECAREWREAFDS